MVTLICLGNVFLISPSKKNASDWLVWSIDSKESYLKLEFFIWGKLFEPKAPQQRRKNAILDNSRKHVTFDFAFGVILFVETDNINKIRTLD